MGMLADIFAHPEEIPALARVRYAAYLATKLPKDPNLAFCYDMLNKVSRSFAVVIQQLGTELRDAVCVFYLVLRGLDTVEDDMEIPIPTKLPILNSFYRHIHDPAWKFVCGTKDYKRLMTEFHFVSEAFLALDKRYQTVIEDITKQMGEGMAKYIVKEVETVEDYNEYCHYVAGLVGIGLSELFAAAGLETLAVESLSNSMGLFLQKTNIIRDYLEDICEEPAPRMFWPKEIWGKYATHLEDFKSMPGEATQAVSCLNELVTDALSHANDCLTYMVRLKDPPIFRFCAIPQVMAMGTLALCYNNVEVFRGVVKLRRGLTAGYINNTRKMSDVYAAFDSFAEVMSSKIDKKDPNAELALDRLQTIRVRCRASHLPAKSASGPIKIPNQSILIKVIWWIVVVSACFLFWLPHLQTSLGLGASLDFLDKQDKVQQALVVLVLATVTVWLLKR